MDISIEKCMELLDITSNQAKELLKYEIHYNWNIEHFVENLDKIKKKYEKQSISSRYFGTPELPSIKWQMHLNILLNYDETYELSLRIYRPCCENSDYDDDDEYDDNYDEDEKAIGKIQVFVAGETQPIFQSSEELNDFEADNIFAISKEDLLKKLTKDGTLSLICKVCQVVY